MDFSSLGLRDSRVLYVASTGGHLAELERIASQAHAAPASALVTFRSPQTAAIDWVDDVHYVPYVRPRDLVGTIRTARFIRSLLRRQRWGAVLSTGAAVAVAALPVASQSGVRSIYVESYARFVGPSTTGRILSRLPYEMELYTQHERWSDRTWHYAGSVLDNVQSASRPQRDVPRRWFVTLGTIAPFRFDSLVESVLSAAPHDAEIVWQLGSTSRTDLPGRVYSHLDSHSFAAEAEAADLVISHAGVGTAINLIEMGHRPIIVPRRAHRREHIDDHQLQIAHDLSARGLVRSCDADDLPDLLMGGSLPIAG